MSARRFRPDFRNLVVKIKKKSYSLRASLHQKRRKKKSGCAYGNEVFWSMLCNINDLWVGWSFFCLKTGSTASLL